MLKFSEVRVSQNYYSCEGTAGRLVTMRWLAPILLILLTGAAVISSAVTLSSPFRVNAEGSDFVATWETGSEVGVRSFEVHRKTATTNDRWVLVESVSARGSGAAYSIRDDQIFKASSELIDYRLQALLDSGAREEIALQAVNYTPTAIRRTWGSIKAMF